MKQVHRALRHKEEGKWVAKPEFTFSDLWSYWILSTHRGFNGPLNTREALEEAKASVLRRANPATEQEEEFFYSLVHRYGVEGVLFGIDRLALSSYEVPDLQLLTKAADQGLGDMRRIYYRL